MSSLKQRIANNTINLTNFNKHDAQQGKVTGKALLVNKVADLCVIDIDINKKLTDNAKQEIRDGIVSKLCAGSKRQGRLHASDIIVKTGSGGCS